jgi:hypothetical protein
MNSFLTVVIVAVAVSAASTAVAYMLAWPEE